MISGYVAHGHLLSALELLETMQLYGLMANRVILECLLRACDTIEYIEHGRLIYCQIITLGLELDRLICNTLADMYAKVGALDEAHKVFHELPCQDVQSWDALISRYVQHGHGVSALKLFDKMQEFGILPSKSTVLHILKACGGTGGYLDQGMLIHYHIIKNGLELDGIIGSTLLDLYARYSSIESAKRVFERLPNLDVVSWGAMISGYVYQGHGHSALELFDEMRR